MIKTFVRLHLSKLFLFFFILLARSEALSRPNPIPANECKVIPPTLHAAKPVEAVTASASGFLS